MKNMEKLVNEIKKIDDKKFKRQIYLFDKYITDEQWASSLKFNMALCPLFANDVEYYVKKLSLVDIKYSDLEEIILELRKKCLDELYYDGSESIVEKWIRLRRAYSYYGFLETINEGSLVCDNLLLRLKNKYGNKYLDVLKDYDVLYPSKLTNINNHSCEIINMNDYDELREIYYLLKRWQDNQHVFHEKELYPIFSEVRKEFNDYIRGINYYNEYNISRSTIAIYLLDNMGIIPIDTIIRFIRGGVDEELISIIGGKNYGLAKLKENGANIPLTYVIPVLSLYKKIYINQLSELNIESFSVRSSATVEDGKVNSFAGMFTSYLNVKFEDLECTIKKVCDSINSNRVKTYVEKFKTKNPKMSVVIQEFREPSYSGVWIGSKIDSGHLEWTHGNGEKLVSGKVKPSYELWENNKCDGGFEINNTFIGKECIKMQKRLNTISDFEWCILDNKLFWVQFRSVTRVFDVKIKDDIYQKSDINGVAASCGIVKGKPKYLEDFNDYMSVNDNDILLTDYTDPDWLQAIVRCKAIVSAQGGFLSHTAIISRELGIPCVTGIGQESLSYLASKNEIIVNGDNGTIKVSQD